MNRINFESINSNLNVYAEIDDAILEVVSHDYAGAERIPVSGLQTNVEQYLYNNMIEYDSRKLKKMINDVMNRENYIKKVVKVNGKSIRAYVQ